MPTYVYKAATSSGLIVRNRVEAGSKQNLIRILKNNDLMPISIDQVAYSSKRRKTKKKNIKDVEEIMKNVNTTDIVTYTIRVYNEGELDGYASKIMDDIPQGLEFVPAEYDKEGKPINTNAVYKWTIYREMKDGEVAIPENMITYNDKNYVVTDKAEEADVIVTDYLSKEYGTSNLLKAFDPKTMTGSWYGL